MNGKTLIETANPITQSIEAVKALLAWKGRARSPLPEFVEMGKGDSRLVLVLANKKDAFYVTTAKACSCPAHAFGHGQRCKHQRKYFPVEAKPVSANDSIRPEGKWAGGFNGPVEA
jgi:hypothetical protein